ncbi:RusA family crossover junction endodeoxyribonuclease [Pseudohoeflea suaedae]|uniref:RusA family crossover junction endodeoxyribonuclease n=1 Tax=Pseudohoeflea suaedae TaxID=877384 RepID=A0A4R5PQI2_9HYPH|nr:RusA family crossover junction endodeoxyribonuclease [Pseudohoeflea suaedae]
MEINFPIEFLVEGTPVSLQAKRSASLVEWRDRVKGASTHAIPSPHFASDERMAVTVYYFPAERMQGDIDNIVKPILDALCRHIYIDDNQVERIVVQKFEPRNVYTFSAPTSTLAQALDARPPMVYVKISTDPHEELV